MIFNLNIGILGHVDSGKTSLAKCLSQISSTAAFDKNPQSKERGITLDLGFSSYQCDIPDRLKEQAGSEFKSLQLTFVDCPGHAKLIRTIIGGAQIIDLMVLVIDINKGIQTQTAECLVIGELIGKPLVIALNKIDLIKPENKIKAIEKNTKKIRTILQKGTSFNADISIVPISATSQENLDEFLDILKQHTEIPIRDFRLPFLFVVDHCFQIKGQGTVLTGTIIQGKVRVNDDIEISTTNIRQIKKVKSIQMFRRSMQEAKQGDRIGLCITQFDSDQLERGYISKPAYLNTIQVGVIKLNRIKYFRGSLKSKSKYHITVGHDTIMARVTFFGRTYKDPSSHEHEYIDEILQDDKIEQQMIFVLLEFENPVVIVPDSLIIASKLDASIDASNCRLAFWGKIEAVCTDLKNRPTAFLADLKIFKEKCRRGTIQRVVNRTEIIVDNLFKKESNRQLFIGLKVHLDTGEVGIIEGTFGATSKIKVKLLNDGLVNETMSRIVKGKLIGNSIFVELKFKKFLYNTSNNKIIQ